MGGTHTCLRALKIHTQGQMLAHAQDTHADSRVRTVLNLVLITHQAGCSCCQGYIVQGTTAAAHSLPHTAAHSLQGFVCGVVQGVCGVQFPEDGFRCVGAGLSTVAIADLYVGVERECVCVCA
jgi:hypothetical protein